MCFGFLVIALGIVLRSIQGGEMGWSLHRSRYGICVLRSETNPPYIEEEPYIPGLLTSQAYQQENIFVNMRTHKSENWVIFHGNHPIAAIIHPRNTDSERCCHSAPPRGWNLLFKGVGPVTQNYTSRIQPMVISINSHADIQCNSVPEISLLSRTDTLIARHLKLIFSDACYMKKSETAYQQRVPRSDPSGRNHQNETLHTHRLLLCASDDCLLMKTPISQQGFLRLRTSDAENHKPPVKRIVTRARALIMLNLSTRFWALRNCLWQSQRWFPQFPTGRIFDM